MVKIDIPLLLSTVLDDSINYTDDLNDDLEDKIFNKDLVKRFDN
jgi:hypothetical protein